MKDEKENLQIERDERIEKAESIRILRFWEMIFLAKGTFFRKCFHAFVCTALRLFFRRIEVAGVERVPKTGAIIFVLNHPNGAVDPGLVFVSLPRRVSFLAKSTLFDIPVAGFLLRTIEALPVYRRVDAGGEMSKNLQTFENCERLLARGRCIAIFPEGVSHDATKLKPIKTGAARIALGALGINFGKREAVSGQRLAVSGQQSVVSGQQSGGELETANGGQQTADGELRSANKFNLQILPAGLFYTSKTAFRSEALIRYGEPFDVEPVALDEKGEPPREAVLKLTERIETALRQATLNLENERELETVLKAEALFSSVYENLLFKKTLTQSFLHLQELAEKYKFLGENEPEKIVELNRKIEEYEDELKTSGLTHQSLSVLQHPTVYVFRYLILRLVILTVLAPLTFVGAVIHSPAYLFSNLVGAIFKTHGVDDAGSTFKILAACLFMPLTWLILGATAFYFFGWQIALLSIPLVILCGYIALRSLETLIDLSVWLKAAWLLFRQRALFLRLLVQRETLQQEIGKIIEK